MIVSCRYWIYKLYINSKRRCCSCSKTLLTRPVAFPYSEAAWCRLMTLSTHRSVQTPLKILYTAAANTQTDALKKNHQCENKAVSFSKSWWRWNNYQLFSTTSDLKVCTVTPTEQMCVWRWVSNGNNKVKIITIDQLRLLLEQWMVKWLPRAVDCAVQAHMML